MPRFSDIIGHSDAVLHLQNAITQKKVSHAYIIEGQAGAGKKMLADAFAMALLCKETEQENDGNLKDACGVCRSCHQIMTRNHPDVVYVTHEKENLIRVQEIRDQIVSDVSVKPYSGQYKIYIVADAEKMSVETQNAILKTLEEPPEYVVILLLTDNASVFLDTIRSRCVTISLKPVQDELVIAYLMENQKLPDYEAKLCAAFAQGSIGKAVLLGGSQSFREIRDLVVRIASKARDMDIAGLSEMVSEAVRYKIEVTDLLELLAVWYRDVLLFKATTMPDQLIFQDQLQSIRSCARLSSYEGIETILEAIDKAKVRLKANVTFELVMELLFLTIKEN